MLEADRRRSQGIDKNLAKQALGLNSLTKEIRIDC